MISPWLLQAIEEGFEEEETFGRQGEVPRRVRRAYADILTEREHRVPQSLAGVRGFKAHPLRFQGLTDIAPPNPLNPGEGGPLDKTAVDATRVGLSALKFTVS
jgi:hypothetical protein